MIARTQTPAAIRRIEGLAGAPGPAFWDAYWACRPAYDAGQASTDYGAAVAARLGVKPADCLLFDDTGRTINAAREAGLRAELFTDPAQVRTLTH